MGIADLLALCLKRWWVVVVGVLGTLLLIWAALHHEPVYYSRSTAQFLAPTSARYPNSLEVSSVSIIHFASIVGRKVEGPSRANRVNSPDVTLYDEGVYDGQRIEMPNYGGQWADNYSSAVLNLEVTGGSSQSVAERMTALQEAVETETLLQQRDAGVADNNFIRVKFSPAAPREVGGSRPRALAISIVLGGAVTLLGVLNTERFLMKRKSRFREVE